MAQCVCVVVGRRRRETFMALETLCTQRWHWADWLATLQLSYLHCSGEAVEEDQPMAASFTINDGPEDDEDHDSKVEGQPERKKTKPEPVAKESTVNAGGNSFRMCHCIRQHSYHASCPYSQPSKLSPSQQCKVACCATCLACYRCCVCLALY